ncbi:tail terminator [Arthrobacter phage Corgi]|uniref:Tail terminator n=1 Tax=Arthrobacter phage Corgi TaxID=2419952 RepID=A0A3G2KF14_9CAUD|nr:tail terminator [Arthrobacter phage Corgi]AYN57557.1 tail terminator [Arthrobacter phage Corgi]
MSDTESGLEALSAAEQLRDKFQAALTNWTWKAAPEPPGNVTRKRYGVIWRTGLGKGSRDGRLVTKMQINIYAARTAGEALERELDDALDDVLLELQRISDVRFQEATRVTFAETFPGWEVLLEIEHNNYYAAAVRQEAGTA